MAVEIVTWSVTAGTEPETVKPVAAAAARPLGAARMRRDVYEPALGRIAEMPVYERRQLAPGMHIDGPAVIVEDETTTLVPASFGASINGSGYIVMERTRHG
jgi:N-methylhydantoinase A